MAFQQQQQTAQAFLSLPRLAGRLTAELIMRSEQGLNACKEYQIDLRGASSSSGVALVDREFARFHFGAPSRPKNLHPAWPSLADSELLLA